MYIDFYGLKEKPFSLTPDPQYLFLSESHRKAIEYLIYGIEQREGFIVITGQIGTGKTTICRALIEKLDKKVKTALILNSFLSKGKLLESIINEFGIKSKGSTKYDRINALNQFLLERLMNGENSVLIIDEAQNLSKKVLEQIRMLSNLETEKEKMLQIVFLGQLELEEKLRSPELKQLNQRITIRYKLLPLNKKEVKEYIYQRLIIAGSNGRITFSRSAIEEIYRYSQGIPRLINLLCDRSLIAGFIHETYLIDKELIEKAKRELEGNVTKNFKPYLKSDRRNLSVAKFALITLAIIFLFFSNILNFNQKHFFFQIGDISYKKVKEIYAQISSKIDFLKTFHLSKKSFNEEKQEFLESRNEFNH